MLVPLWGSFVFDPWGRLGDDDFARRRNANRVDVRELVEPFIGSLSQCRPGTGLDLAAAAVGHLV